jgi:Tfp pilus assembly protein PilN
VLAVAADGDEIQERVQACSVAGIAMDVVEPSSLAYARAFLSRRNPSQGSGDALIALLGPRTLTIQLFLRGTLDFVRTRSLPDEVKTTPLLCAWLTEELKAVARYGETQAPQAGGHWQSRVVIHDGVHTASEMSPLLAAQAGPESFTVVDAREPWSGPDATKDEEVSMAAVGAALGLLETAGDNLKINLLPQTVAAARSLSRHVLVTALVGIVLFLGIFATAGLLARTTGAMDRKIEQTRLSEELYAAPALIAKEKFLDQEIARLRHRLAPLRQALAGRHQADWPEILAAVRQAAPAEVSVAQWQCSDGKTLSLKGFAPSCPAAEAFVRNLESQRPFEAISLALVQRPQDAGDRPEYRIDCLLKGPPNAARRVGDPETKGGKSS